ncbi:MAG: transcription factor [Thermoproteota archaeon]
MGEDRLDAISHLYTQIIGLIGGDEAVEVAEALIQLKKASEEQISTKTGLRVGDVRKILFKLYEKALITYEEVKKEEGDRIKSVFLWMPLIDQIEGIATNYRRMILQKLREKLAFAEGNELYHCGKEGHRLLVFDEAVENIFKCPVCSEPLFRMNKEEYIRKLSTLIKTIENEEKE